MGGNVRACGLRGWPPPMDVGRMAELTKSTLIEEPGREESGTLRQTNGEEPGVRP